MLFPNPDEELVNQTPDGRRVRVNPRHDLRNNHEPRVNRDVPETLHERGFHFGGGAVVEPQGK